MSSGGARRFGAVVVALVCAVAGLAAAAAPARAASPTVDGQFVGGGPIAGGSSIDLTVVGRGGVPASGVGAVARNVTATNPKANSYLTVWPAGAARPTASNLNVVTGQTVPNMVIVPVGAGGKISIFNFAGTVDVIVDVLGWFPTGAAYTGLTPARLMDTRPGLPTVDGAASGAGPVGAGGTTDLTVVGRGGVPATGVGAVALNVTATGPTANSYVTVWPAGAARPTASNLNVVAGQTVPNMVIVPVGAGGKISLFNFAGTVDLVVDVLGWFPAGGSYTGLSPARLMDTRPGLPTVDGQAVGAGPVGQGGTTDLTVVGRGGVPASGVGAVALNVTVTNPTLGSFLTVWPAGEARPTASNLNMVAGQTVPNMVIVPVGAGGKISIFNNGGTVDVIVDVLGWFPTGGGYTGLSPARLLETRATPPAAIGAVRNLLVVRPTLHQMAGTDRVAVWVCDVPAGSTASEYADPRRLSVDLAAVTQWANDNATPYYAAVSGGRYVPTFVAAGRLALTTSEGFEACLAKTIANTGRPFTNSFATDTSTFGIGLGSPGGVTSLDSYNYNLFDQPPSETRRGLWVGGGSVVDLPAPNILIHEIGHSLHWPHSYTGPASPYDNPTDIMSDMPDDGWCERSTGGGGTLRWPCVAQNTMAFDRFAAGWIDDAQVAVHNPGTASYTLIAPSADGLQIVAIPAPGNPKVMLTVEARPKTGNDRFLAVEGVSFSIVDQRGNECPNAGAYGGSCVSVRRRQGPALGAPGTYQHVVPVGASATAYGVTVTVTAKVGAGFTVDVAGTFAPPAELPQAIFGG